TIVSTNILVDDLEEFSPRRTVNGHAIFLEQSKTLARVEWPVVEKATGAATPRSKQNAGSRLRPTDVGGAPDDVVRSEIEPVNCRDAPRVECTCSVRDPFGKSRRT